MYYVADAYLVIACCIVFFLDVSTEKVGQKTTEALKKIFTIPSVVLLGLVSMLGLLLGIKESYFAVYMEGELNASVSMIGE